MINRREHLIKMLEEVCSELDIYELPDMHTPKTRRIRRDVLESDSEEEIDRIDSMSGMMEEISEEELRERLDRYRGRLERYEEGDWEPTIVSTSSNEIELESDLVEKLEIILRYNRIEYDKEYNISSDGYPPMKADVVLHNYEVSIECKKDTSLGAICKAIGQCHFHRMYGYSPIILVPKPPRNSTTHHVVEAVEKSGIPLYQLVNYKYGDVPLQLVNICNGREELELDIFTDEQELSKNSKEYYEKYEM